MGDQCLGCWPGRKLEAVVAEREKFSFQPYITSPPSAINLIMARMCSIGQAPTLQTI